MHAIGAGGALAWSVDLGADVDGAAGGRRRRRHLSSAPTRTRSSGSTVAARSPGARRWAATCGASSPSRATAMCVGRHLRSRPAARPGRPRWHDSRVLLPSKGTGAREFGIHGGPARGRRGHALLRRPGRCCLRDRPGRSRTVALRDRRGRRCAPFDALRRQFGGRIRRRDDHDAFAVSDARRVSSANRAMVAIPPAKDTDAEDVAWGLQTAEALWKRGERIDAIVWLRRAAQAAGDAADDDRALELARSAAELSDWMATQPPGTSMPPAAQANRRRPLRSAQRLHVRAVRRRRADRPGSGPGQQRRPQRDVRPASADLRASACDRRPMRRGPRRRARIRRRRRRCRRRSPIPAVEAMATPPPRRRLRLRRRKWPLPIPTPIAPPVAELDEPGHDDEQGRSESTSVPPAEHVHAGMFNPWDEGALPAPAPAVALPPPAARFADEEEVITSVRPGQLAQQRADALAAALAQGQLPSAPPSAPPDIPVASSIRRRCPPRRPPP